MSKIKNNLLKEKDVTKSVGISEKILDFILIIICVIFNAAIFILSKDYNIKIAIISFIFTIVIIVLFYLKKRFFNRYMNDILVKLSDMLSTISGYERRRSIFYDRTIRCFQNFNIKH